MRFRKCSSQQKNKSFKRRHKKCKQQIWNVYHKARKSPLKILQNQCKNAAVSFVLKLRIIECFLGTCYGEMEGYRTTILQQHSVCMLHCITLAQVYCSIQHFNSIIDLFHGTKFMSPKIAHVNIEYRSFK